MCSSTTDKPAARLLFSPRSLLQVVMSILVQPYIDGGQPLFLHFFIVCREWSSSLVVCLSVATNSEHLREWRVHHMQPQGEGPHRVLRSVHTPGFVWSFILIILILPMFVVVDLYVVYAVNVLPGGAKRVTAALGSGELVEQVRCGCLCSFGWIPGDPFGVCSLCATSSHLDFHLLLHLARCGGPLHCRRCPAICFHMRLRSASCSLRDCWPLLLPFALALDCRLFCSSVHPCGFSLLLWFCGADSCEFPPIPI